MELMTNSRFKILLILLAFTCNAVHAIYPSGTIKIHNAKVKSISREKLDKQWFDYIYEYPEVLTPEGKKYKVDHYCSYSLELDTEGKILIDSIKLLKHKQNFKYNLKAIQFLRENPLVLHKANPDKPVELEFIYESF
jgi:hypothetical protein